MGKRVHIYYVSGTGNSYRLACFVDQSFRKAGYVSRLESTRKVDLKKEITGQKLDFLVLAFPAHGFTAPWEMLKFACRLPRKWSEKAFCLASRGALKAGRIIVPGMSGSATFIISLILFLKGFRVVGVLSQNMPSNWSTVHPIQKTSSHQFIIERARKRVLRFMDRILTKKREWINFNNMYEIVFGILLLPISVAYLYIGRYFHGKLFFANNKCNGCKICINNCPFDAIRLKGRKRPLPFWTYRCESCMRCATICPERAIEIGQSWGAILFYLWGIPITFYFLNYLGEYFSSVNQIKGTTVSEIITVLFWYPTVFIPYIIFQLLLRVPPIHWLFTHTTMTHFKWWGRYKEPGTRLKKI